MQIISYNQALKQNLTRYFTGTPCKHDHICERYVCNKACVTCHDAVTKKFANANRDYFRKASQRIRDEKKAADPEGTKKAQRDYQNEYRKTAVGHANQRKAAKRYYDKQMRLKKNAKA